MKPRHPSELAAKSINREPLYAAIVPLSFGRARLVVTDGFFVDDGW